MFDIQGSQINAVILFVASESKQSVISCDIAAKPNTPKTYINNSIKQATKLRNAGCAKKVSPFEQFHKKNGCLVLIDVSDNLLLKG